MKINFSSQCVKNAMPRAIPNLRYLPFISDEMKLLPSWIKADPEPGTDSTKSTTSAEPSVQTEGERSKPIEIPEDVFIAYDPPQNQQSMDETIPTRESLDIQTLIRYLEKNLEKQGYEDALTNPDSSYMEQSLRYVHNELNLMIQKVRISYSAQLRVINFHIETRQRNGMLETVDELITHKATMEDEIQKLSEIESDAKTRSGLCENLFVGYTRGFKNGFAAITYNQILKRSNT
jgi:hypothetical protein